MGQCILMNTVYLSTHCKYARLLFFIRSPQNSTTNIKIINIKSPYSNIHTQKLHFNSFTRTIHRHSCIITAPVLLHMYRPGQCWWSVVVLVTAGRQWQLISVSASPTKCWHQVEGASLQRGTQGGGKMGKGAAWLAACVCWWVGARAGGKRWLL